MATPPGPGPVPRIGLRPGGEVLRAGLTAALTLALLLPLVLLDRPPARPRLTFIGGADGLSLLVEGAGGGRVVVGGGAAQTDVASALGRLLRPWDRRLDLLLVADARDLPGAVDLVRYGDVRRVALLGLEGTRSAAALAALREAAGQRGVPIEELGGGERIRVGADGGVLLEVLAGQDEGASLRLSAGETAVAVLTGAAGTVEPAPLAVVLRAAQEPYRAALAAHPGLVIAPALPTGQAAAPEGTAATRLAIVGTGQRATLELAGQTLRLSGPPVQALPTSTPRR